MKLLNCTRLKAVTERSIRVVRNMSPTVPDPYVTWSPLLPENVKNPLARKLKVEERQVEMEADLVVLAVGRRPDDSLYEGCVRDAVAPEVHNIGDSFSVGRVFEATKAGYAVGRGL